MKLLNIGKLILLPIMFVNSRANEQHYLAIDQANEQQLVVPTGDFQHLATEWAKEHNNIKDEVGWWIDFDSSQPDTRKFCQTQDAKHRLKDCKTTIFVEGEDLQIDNVASIQQNEREIYHVIDEINNSSERNKFSFKKEINQTDVYEITTTNTYKFGNSIGVIVRLPLRLGIILKKSFEWDTSKTEREFHSESKSITISEKLNLKPCSKTNVKSVVKEFNYDADFSANVIINGFFVYRNNKHWYRKKKMYIWDVAKPIICLKEWNLDCHPYQYSEYLRKLAEPYSWEYSEENGYKYWIVKYNATGKIQGVYDHDEIDGSIVSTPLNISSCQVPTKTITATETVTETGLPNNGANSLKANRKYLVGVALLSGALLL